MAPKKQPGSEKDAKVKSLLSFAASLPSRIDEAESDSTLIEDIQSHLKSLPLAPSTVTAAHAVAFDVQGTELWNFATRLRRDGDALGRSAPSNSHNAQQGVAQVACFVRVLAFFMVDSGWQSSTRSGQHKKLRGFKETMRLMRIVLKAGKSCLVLGAMDMCVRLMERAADFEGALGKAAEGTGEEDDKTVAIRLRAQYFVLRTTLAWKQSRLDIAEHMFSKANIPNSTLDPTSSEELSDSLFEMGKDLLGKRQFEVAARWLERSLDILDGTEIEQLSPDAGDLRLSIMQHYAKALLGLQTTDARSKARDIVTLMETDYAEKMIVSLLKLEIILSEETVDADQYYNVINRMIRTIMLTANNIKTLMHHIHRLKTISPCHAVTALDDLLELRLVEVSDKAEWIEKAMITRIWISTLNPDDGTALRSLQDFLEIAFRVLRQPPNVTATHAAQTLLWKRIESAFAAGHFDFAESWCQLAMHKLLENCGDINKSKVARKRILCSLSRQEFNRAREIYFQMPESSKAAPMTRYLMYKVALRSGDAEFAAENLEALCKSSSKDATLLYACVMEAQQAGNKQQTALALQKVLGKYDYGAPRGVHLPALLRCMTRLLTSEVPANSAPNDQIAEEICKVFTAAATQARKKGSVKNGDAKDAFDTTELEWFSRCSYNLALKWCTDISPHHLIRLLSACASHQSYLAVRICGRLYRERLPEQLKEETLSEPAQEDLKDKHFRLLKFELEAALKLLQWDDMDELFEECWKYENSKHWETLADLVLVIHASMVEAKLDTSHLHKILAVLQKIINHTYRTKSSDTLHLGQWIRCLFQLAISFDEGIGIHCLDQAYNIAQKKKGTSGAYPNTELEWLATTSFNRAVDYYCASDDVKTKLWAEKSLMLADALDDRGALLKLLREKYSALSWS
ncbi:SPO22-domain-containing protein [Rhizodiscina lignyota]|uniref:SPO22-domain-containing protein n=1 Tax=Rhizodiscina lignyota TaxID=1504668 RepID=A0A9P4IDV7_9PEZI|nr:SPO22-domain-containing protein [Rhizodiscina lignyota]